MPASPPTSGPPVAWPEAAPGRQSGSNLPRPPAPPPVNTFNKQLAFAAIGGIALVVIGLFIASRISSDSSVVVDAAPQATAAPAVTSDRGGEESTSPPQPETPVPNTAPPGATQPDAPPPDAGPSATPDPDQEDTDPDQEDTDFRAVVADIARFVEAERGLDFKTEPLVVVLDDEAFVAQYNELLAEDIAENAELYDAFSGIYHAIGILGSDVSLQEANEALAEGVIGGYYDPATGELYVRGGSTTPLVRAIIAHELVHALDDQWFDLDRTEYDDRDDEIGFGFRAVVEGNARRIENAYRATFTSAEQAEARSEEIGLSGGLDLSLVSLAFLEIQLSPYQDGSDLVGALLAAGGQPTLDAAIEDPPSTSEAVLYPSTLGQQRTEVAPPPADGTVIEDGVFGAVVVRSLLSPVVGQAGARQAAQGWGGDWFVAWNDADRTCVRVDLVGDTQKDTDELAAGFAQWAQQQPDAQTQTVGALLRVTSCG